MKVAVVGSGVSGLASTWLLNEHSNHQVHLYESDPRPGGHANTVQFAQPGKESVTVDTGFIVFNPSTYPNFLRFLKMYTSVQILPTEMTFSVSRDGGLFEWAGSNLFTVFCQPTRLLDPNMWRLVYDVLRFNACARRLVIGWKKSCEPEDLSVGEYLDREGYSQSFRDNYLVPMTAAIWSTPPDKCAMDFPARTLIQFMNNHHLLQLTGKPSWLTIKGGSHAYVKTILTKLPENQLHLSTAVKSLKSHTSTIHGKTVVRLETADGRVDVYDHVILACHSDTAVNILQSGNALQPGDGITEDERRVLGRFSWSKNYAVLHSDTELMPKRRIAWSCWNYLTSSVYDSNGNHKANKDQISLKLELVNVSPWLVSRELTLSMSPLDWMNDLQHLSEKKHGPVFVTLNPPTEPAADKTVGQYHYDHPVLDGEALRSQNEMHLIQGKRGISFAGAWTRYGFHEDGFTSGLRAVVDHLGVKPPFIIQDADQEPLSVRAALVFDLLEHSGTRTYLGSFLSFWLGVCRFWLGFLIDLSHISDKQKIKVD